jgi:hypothetical protein
MKRPGPLLTLAAGVLRAGALLVLDLNANRAEPARADAPGAEHTSPPPATSTPTATAGPAAPAPPDATYAGAVDGGSGASVAIAVRGGVAVAYVCDGHRAEAWLQGPAASGEVSLTGRAGANLRARYLNARITGTVTAAGKTWTFTVGVVKPPSGLYRAAAKVRSAQVVAGWIVLADGRQVGVVNDGGTESAAPHLDTTTRTSVVAGSTVSASPVDGTPLPADGE